jgi:hypothetical protein
MFILLHHRWGWRSTETWDENADKCIQRGYVPRLNVLLHQAVLYYVASGSCVWLDPWLAWEVYSRIKTPPACYRVRICHLQ